ncbi:MAG TPA: NADPH-dependent assimilatory sulfite reductase hemoprotein subunit [Pirellulales bacterium]|jgi:sulfite reductase (ferredoxin)|nr:NADPH-dependent assimilatory sulfite reductase hemoprotein subunit [Pirellulales bacterium]
MADESKPSAVETFKLESNYLRGTIAEELASDADSFGKASIQLLKNHGTYQQDDRDARSAGRVEGHKGKAPKAYSFMVRTRVPGGKLTSDQLLAELDLCDEVGNATLRITSRQGLQLHGILKQDLRETIARIHQVQLTTLAACGDVERNVMCCPAPYKHNPVRAQLQQLADDLAAHLAPRSRGYHEIWLTDLETGDEQLVVGGPPAADVEPIYGPTYLPRKFKTAIGLPADNCVDLYANDLGLLAIVEGGKAGGDRIIGYNVLVGGGMGVTPSADKTFPALAKRMAFIRPEQAIDVATAVIKVQRDFGNRSDRKVARLKYLIANRGLPWFKSKVEEYYGAALPEPHPDDVHGFDDHLGWYEQGDGRWFYGLNIENGRIQDEGDLRLKTALRLICSRHKPTLRLTAHQSVLLADIAPDRRSDVEAILRDHGVKLSNEISNLRRWSMACVAWPTCGLSITEAERALPGLVDQLEVELARLGLSSETFTLRMTGCPNGCARPYNSDIGLVGRAAHKYGIFVGGRLLGDRLNFLFRDLVPTEQIVPSLTALLTYYKQDRQPGETVGDFCHRKGNDDLLLWTNQFQGSAVA